MINTFLMNAFMMSETLSKSLPKFSSTEINAVQNSKEKSYLKAARQNANEARAEMSHGVEAQAIAEASGDQNFNKIAHWHFELCTNKANKAEKYFLAAQQILTSRRRREYCRLRAVEMSQLGARAHFLESSIFADNHLTIN